MTGNGDGMDWLSKTWKLCKPLKNSDDVKKVKSWLNEVYVNLAMVNYPYPSTFLADLPGYPIRVFCSHLKNDSLKGKELLSDLVKGLNVYFNFSGGSKCLDIDSSETNLLGDQGWDFQVRN